MAIHKYEVSYLMALGDTLPNVRLEGRSSHQMKFTKLTFDAGMKTGF